MSRTLPWHGWAKWRRSGIRPESVTLSASPTAEPGWKARIDLTEHLGDTVLAFASIAGLEEPLSLKLAARNRRPWQRAWTSTSIPKRALYLFDESGKRIGSI